MAQREAFADTRVPWHKSRGEIEMLVRRHTAVIGISWAELTDHQLAPKGGSLVVLRWICTQQLPDGTRATMGLRIGVPIPSARADKERQQHANQRHRALYWWLKAKFDAVQAGLISFPEEFLSHIETGGGRTVFEALGPQLVQGLGSGEMRPLALLPGREG